MEEIIIGYYQRYLKDFMNGEEYDIICLPEYISIGESDIDTASKLLREEHRSIFIYPHYNDTQIEYRIRIMDRALNKRDLFLFNSIREYIKYGGVAMVEGELFEVYIPFNTEYVGEVNKQNLSGFVFKISDRRIFVGSAKIKSTYKRYSGVIDDGA